MVGSKVTFIDGVPFKDSYRRYKIKHGQGNNDYLSIQEINQPPLSRSRNAATNFSPDVILIDGGCGPGCITAMDVFKTSWMLKPPMVISIGEERGVGLYAG